MILEIMKSVGLVRFADPFENKRYEIQSKYLKIVDLEED